MKQFNLKLLFSFLIIIIFRLIFLFTIELVEPQVPNYVTVDRNLKIEEDYISFESKVDYKWVSIIYFSTDEGIKLDGVKYGSILAVSGEIDLIENKYSNSASVDFEKIMLAKKIKYQYIIDDFKIVGTDKTLTTLINNVRFNRTYSATSKLDKYLNALVFGHNDLDEEVYEIYQNIGIIHLFSISGTHVLIICQLIRLGLGRLGFYRHIIDKLFLIILPIYVCLTGFSHSVIRASIMYLHVIKHIVLKNLRSPLIVTVVN